MLNLARKWPRVVKSGSMIPWWIAGGLAVPLVFLFAFSIAHLLRNVLHQAAQHGNTALPALHVALIATVSFFALHGFWLF